MAAGLSPRPGRPYRKRVRITGIVVSEDLVDVDGVAPENITSSPRAAGVAPVHRPLR